MSRLRAALFDLDDTLYPEMDFARSGFRTAARYLSSRLHVPDEEIFTRMMAVLGRDGSGRVFDSVLLSLGAHSEDLVSVCVHLYRSHRPDISLFEDAAPTLERLRSARVRLGILTDGMGVVQRSKIEALRLEPLVDVVVLSDVLGPKSSKPSGDGYRVALDLLDARPEEAAYVGDNPAKDFLWPNAAGMLSIRIRRRGAASEGFPEAARARHEIDSLLDVGPLLGR